MLPDHIYTRRDPIVAGVKVEVSGCLIAIMDHLAENLEEEMESHESILILECPGWYYQVWHPALCPKQGVHLLGNMHITSGGNMDLKLLKQAFVLILTASTILLLMNSFPEK